MISQFFKNKNLFLVTLYKMKIKNGLDGIGLKLKFVLISGLMNSKIIKENRFSLNGQSEL